MLVCEAERTRFASIRVAPQNVFCPGGENLPGFLRSGGPGLFNRRKIRKGRMPEKEDIP